MALMESVKLHVAYIGLEGLLNSSFISSDRLMWIVLADAAVAANSYCFWNN